MPQPAQGVGAAAAAEAEDGGFLDGILQLAARQVCVYARARAHARAHARTHARTHAHAYSVKSKASLVFFCALCQQCVDVSLGGHDCGCVCGGMCHAPGVDAGCLCAFGTDAVEADNCG